ncbi:MAG TPA: transposase [Gemmata sp.]
MLLGEGTTLSGSDTPAQEPGLVPQHKNQKRGLGFPLIRVVVLLGFATGARVGAAIGPGRGKEAGRMAPLREVLDRFHPGDAFVADRAYCPTGFWPRSGPAGAMGASDCLHPGTPTSSRDDSRGPVPGAAPGYRTREIVVATTLTDATSSTPEGLAELYHRRWRVERSIRDIKRTLAMDVLGGKSPEMLRREIWRPLTVAGWEKKVAVLVHVIGGRRVGRRPGRCEPREVKRRPRSDWRVTKPRAERRAERLAN